MKNEKEIAEIANQILECEEIISNKNSLGKDVKSAKRKIDNIISLQNFEDLFMIDDYIMKQKYLTN